MSTSGDAESVTTSDDGDHEVPHAKGTFVLMLIFLALIAAMWIWMYVTMLQRG